MSLEESLSEWVDDIAKRIPGFGGYYKKEKRRENDQRLRERIFHKLNDIQDILNERGRIITKSGDLSPLDGIEQIRKRLEKLMDGIRYAEYGYSGFFDEKEISMDTLRSVYKVDLELLHWVKDFISCTDIDSELDDVNDYIENGLKLLKKRSEIIEGV